VRGESHTFLRPGAPGPTIVLPAFRSESQREIALFVEMRLLIAGYARH
jgi:hypothetical protein